MRPNAATMPDARPGWCDRLLAALCYVGFGPLLAPWRRVRTRPFVQHHLAQGLAVGMLAVLLALALLAAAVGWAWFIVNHREIVRSVGDADGWAVAVAFLVWAAFMLGGLVLALCGSSRRLPLLHQLTAGSRRRCVAILVNLGAYGLLVLVVGMTCHAAAICRSDDGPAPVYVLYDDMDFFPRWVFQLGAYPIALTADARWGPGSTVVLPLRRPTLDRALEHARVLVLLCHGRDGAVVSGRLCVAAPTPQAGAPGVPRLLGALPIPTHGQDWEPLAVGDRLQLAYITACDGGRNAAGWRGALAPAEVTTFDRLSAVLEHVWWLWMVAPGKVRRLPDVPASASAHGGERCQGALAFVVGDEMEREYNAGGADPRLSAISANSAVSPPPCR